jgi:sortase B
MASYAPRHRREDTDEVRRDRAEARRDRAKVRRNADGSRRSTDGARRSANESRRSAGETRQNAKGTRRSANESRRSAKVARQSAGSKRSRIALALGIVFIAIALVIAAFLLHKYITAGQQHEADLEASGLDLAIAGDTVVTGASLDDLVVNWDALKAINSDIVGWVMIPGTRVNYPIVQASDNDYYLNHLFDKTSSDAGAIFLDSENDPAITGWNNIIYGHNLIDGSMFASLKSYRERAFLDEHRTVLLATPEKNYRLEVVAALVCDADDKIRRFGFTDRTDYNAYVEMLLEYAVLNDLGEGDIPENLYCFATCTDTNYLKRTLILASVAETKEPA